MAFIVYKNEFESAQITAQLLGTLYRGIDGFVARNDTQVLEFAQRPDVNLAIIACMVNEDFEGGFSVMRQLKQARPDITILAVDDGEALGQKAYFQRKAAESGAADFINQLEMTRFEAFCAKYLARPDDQSVKQLPL